MQYNRVANTIKQLFTLGFTTHITITESLRDHTNLYVSIDVRKDLRDNQVINDDSLVITLLILRCAYEMSLRSTSARPARGPTLASHYRLAAEFGKVPSPKRKHGHNDCSLVHAKLILPTIRQVDTYRIAGSFIICSCDTGKRIASITGIDILKLGKSLCSVAGVYCEINIFLINKKY